MNLPCSTHQQSLVMVGRLDEDKPIGLIFQYDINQSERYHSSRSISVRSGPSRYVRDIIGFDPGYLSCVHVLAAHSYDSSQMSILHGTTAHSYDSSQMSILHGTTVIE